MHIVNTSFLLELIVKKITYYTCCYLLMLFSCSAYSASSKDCIQFHVIHSEPLGYMSEDGKPTGIHWEYIEALKNHSGLCIDAKLMPYARIWKSVEYGNHDGGIIFKSQSRDPLVQYGGHIQTIPTVVVPLKGITLNDYSDLSKLLIGNMNGVHLSEKFDNDKSLKLLELVDFDQGTRMINLKRLDAVAGNGFALLYQFRKFGVLDKVDLTNQLKLGEKEQWLQMSNKSRHLASLPVLQKSVAELKESGVFREILVKYYGPEVLKHP